MAPSQYCGWDGFCTVFGNENGETECASAKSQPDPDINCLCGSYNEIMISMNISCWVMPKKNGKKANLMQFRKTSKRIVLPEKKIEAGKVPPP
jgi:hypothetical protein